jgi:hypothetical protein
VILGRFGASAIVCRAVATYELAGMRAAKKFDKVENGKETDVLDEGIILREYPYDL